MLKLKVYTKLFFCLFMFVFVADTYADGISSQSKSVGIRIPFVSPRIVRVHYGTVGLAHYAGGERFTRLKVSGYARAYAFYRDMKKYYPDFNTGSAQGTTMPQNLTLGDGYQEPLFLIRLEGNPTTSIKFQVEYMFNNYLLRQIYNQSDSLGRFAGLYRQFQFTAEKSTNFGRFKLIAGGGVNWYSLSPYTVGAGAEYRDELFERFPWEPEGSNFARYSNYYSSGNIARDQRWGNSATQGFILEGNDLPAGFSFSAIYGKGPGSAGFQSYLSKRPLNLLGLRIKRNVNVHSIGYNVSNQFGYEKNNPTYKLIPDVHNPEDTFFIDQYRSSQMVTTLDGAFRFKKFNVYVELGLGSYLSSIYNDGLKQNLKPGINHLSGYKRNWDEVIFAEVDFNKWRRLPFKVNYYRVGPNVINFGSAIYNSSIDKATILAGQSITNSTNNYDGLLTDIGLITNNRQGTNIFLTKRLGALLSKLSMGITQELINQAGDMRNGARIEKVSPGVTDSLSKVPFTNSITFQHHLNAITRSRFNLFSRFYGPYSRITSDYRRTFENIVITDSVTNYKKSFSTLDLELKYRFNLFKRSLIVFTYITYGSVQDKLSIIPVFTTKAFLRNYYQEGMLFYNIVPKVTVVGYIGIERVMGNSRTELADLDGEIIKNASGRPVYRSDGKPINQLGHGYGIGVDYDFHKRATLVFRNRWFNHKDKNFIKDEFDGFESSLELKIFF